MALDPTLFPLATANSVHTYTEEVSNTISLDLPEVWEAIVGNFFSESSYWVEGYKFHNIDTTKENAKWSKDAWTPAYSVTIVFEGVEGFEEDADGYSRKTITAEDLAKAYTALVRKGWTHCGGSSIDDPDACVVDSVLQHALFGEEVFG